jgi:hypothetical protein
VFKKDLTEGLSSGISDLIMQTKDFEDVLQGLANNILSGVLKVAIDSLTSQIADLFSSMQPGKGSLGSGGFDLSSVFGSLDFSSGVTDFGSLDMGSTFSGFFNGGTIPNYAEGGIVAALRKERMMSGRQPVLAALTPGERVLTVRQNKRFEELQMNKILNYSSGGVVGSSPSFQRPMTGNQIYQMPISVGFEGSSETADKLPMMGEVIKSAIIAEIQRQKKPGGILS